MTSPGAGNDVISAGRGRDTAEAGAGNDRVIGQSGQRQQFLSNKPRLGWDGRI
ncbi:MAG: hypothetical protein ACFB5Z_18425 [Elainellaceae cyanobacterium]